MPSRPALPAKGSAGRRPRGPLTLIVLALVGVSLFAGLVALGVWQVERRTWKIDLIQRVEARAYSPAQPVPTADTWANITAADDEYRRVAATGVFEHDRETLTQATTDLGSGFWVITPLRQDDGSRVLINRGFVLPAWRDPTRRQATEWPGRITVTGYLRLTEPAGGFLRTNDPAADRWHSRDVGAITSARQLNRTAPFFIDADAAGPQAATAGQPGQAVPMATQRPGAALNPPLAARQPDNPMAWPAAGLTALTFHNSHLIYAFTWFALAAMVAAAALYVAREEQRLRSRREANTLRFNDVQAPPPH